LRFDEGLAGADMLLVSLWPGMNGDYCRLPNGLQIRVEQSLRRSIRSKPDSWFEENFHMVELSHADRLGLIAAALDALEAKSQDHCRVFVLGCYTHGIPEKLRPAGHMTPRLTRRWDYNEACRKACEAKAHRFRYVDVDA